MVTDTVFTGRVVTVPEFIFGTKSTILVGEEQELGLVFVISILYWMGVPGSTSPFVKPETMVFCIERLFELSSTTVDVLGKLTTVALEDALQERLYPVT